MIIWSGSTGSEIRGKFPGLLAAADEKWCKGSSILDRMDDYGWHPDKMTIVDDTDHLRRAAAGVLRNEGCNVVVLPETGLGSLIADPAG